MSFPTFFLLIVTLVHPSAEHVTKWNVDNLRNHIDSWTFPMTSEAACKAAIDKFIADSKAQPPTGAVYYFQCDELKPTPVEQPA